jgi:hypothetical protein
LDLVIKENHDDCFRFRTVFGAIEAAKAFTLSQSLSAPGNRIERDSGGSRSDAIEPPTSYSRHYRIAR